MSVHYIIDGYNFANHPLFSRSHKKREDVCFALLEFIRLRGLCGSRKNKITVVFDGHPPSTGSRLGDTDIEVIFSRDEEADERIKKLLEKSSNPRNITVVTDDKQIIFAVRAIGGRPVTIEEFMASKKRNLPPAVELTYTQMHQINQELKQIWLK